MNTTYSNLRITSLTEEQHEKTCGYWYTVSNRDTSHTAFTTKAGALEWLAERGLNIDNELPEPGVFSTQAIIGQYQSEMHMDEGEFYMLNNRVGITKDISNGDVVLAIITEKDGIRTIHTLNPNVSRLVYPYERK